jgi:hypothetical protein
MTKKAKRLGLMVVALLTAAPVSPHFLPGELPSISLDRAEARVGRPLTPMSVAGVRRRAIRRGYYGAAVGVGAYGAYRYYGAPRACGYYPYPPCY